MAGQLIPHFRATNIIGEYRLLNSNFIDGTLTSYRVKDLPDIADVHLDQGSVCNVISIQIKVQYDAAISNPPAPSDGVSFTFDKTWTRFRQGMSRANTFLAIDLNSTQRLPSSLTDNHSDPTQPGGLREVFSDTERNALTPAFIDEVIAQEGAFYSAISMATGAWRITKRPVTISPKKTAHIVNGIGNNWRDPRSSPALPPVLTAHTERCSVIFFEENGFLQHSTGGGTSLLIGTSGPINKNDISVSGGDPRTLTRFQDLIGTAVNIYQPQVTSGGLALVMNLSLFFPSDRPFMSFTGIQEAIWRQFGGNLEVYGSSTLGPPFDVVGGTARVALKIVRKLPD